MPQKEYTLKITLLEVEPPIWRRVIVPADISLDRLHDVIQIVMGWEDYHLHVFTFGDKQYSERHKRGDLEELSAADEATVRLNKLVKKPKARFEYLYDFGDGWLHEVMVEKIVPVPSTERPAVTFVKGERACPPEDSGGPPFYAELLEDFYNPPEEISDEGGVPKDFDPVVCDHQGIEDRLRTYARWSRPRRLPFFPE